MMTIEKQELVEFGSIHPSSINDTNNQLTISTADSKIKYPAFNLHEWCVENYLKYERLPYLSKNDKRLYSALKLFDNLHLLKTTLLDKAAHKRHSINLYKRLLRKFRKTLIPNESSSKRISRMGLSPSGYFESKEHRMARDLIRLVTVVH